MSETPRTLQSIEGQALFELLFEFSPDAIVVTDSNGRITNANAQVQQAFGYTREELIAKPIEALIPERFRSTHTNHRQTYNAKPSVRPMGKELELYGLRKDGTEFPVDIMLSPVETVEGRVIVSVIRDISERKNAQEALRRSERQLRALFEFSPDAIIASDQEGRIRETNAQVERFFGYSRAELLGESIEILVPERFRRTHPVHRKEYSDQARVRQMGIGLELFGRRKDGSEFPVDIMLGPVETAARSGQSLGEVTSVISTTARSTWPSALCPFSRPVSTTTRWASG